MSAITDLATGGVADAMVAVLTVLGYVSSLFVARWGAMKIVRLLSR